MRRSSPSRRSRSTAARSGRWPTSSPGGLDRLGPRRDHPAPGRRRQRPGRGRPRRGPARQGVGAAGAVPTHALAVLPDEVSFAQARGAARRRHHRAAGPRHRRTPIARRVLVTGASGGVGRFAVQLAHIGGAHVTAVSASPERARGLADLGADEVIHELTPEGPDFDVIVEGVGGPSLGAADPARRARRHRHLLRQQRPERARRVPDPRALRPRPRRAHLRPDGLPRAGQAPRRDRDARPRWSPSWPRAASTRTSTSRRAGAEPATPVIPSSSAASPARSSSTSTDPPPSPSSPAPIAASASRCAASSRSAATRCASAPATPEGRAASRQLGGDHQPDRARRRRR